MARFLAVLTVLLGLVAGAVGVAPPAAATDYTIMVSAGPRVTVKKTWTITGKVLPAKGSLIASRKALVQQYRRGKWHTLDRAQIEADGSYHGSVTFSTRGTKTVRVYKPATSESPAVGTNPFKILVMKKGAGTTARLIRYSSGGADIHTSADLAQLRGTSAAFKQFILGVSKQAARAAHDHCAGGDGVATVRMYRTDGFAVGSWWACAGGGYDALWAKESGRWRKVAGTQDGWTCAVLRKHRIPQALVDGGTCYTSGGSEAVYVQP